MIDKRITDWIESEEKSWRLRQAGELPEFRILSFGEIASIPSPPEWALRDLEQQYRRGFRHGISEAGNLVRRLYKAGYVRPQEISNMLEDWTKELHRWSFRALDEKPLQWDGHPKMKFKKWVEMKTAAHERDGWCCTHCGSENNLEAHHIHPVARGGLPRLENLTTLCATCHSSL